LNDPGVVALDRVPSRALVALPRQLLGILSIGDLVQSVVAEQDMTIDQLEQYIHRG